MTNPKTAAHIQAAQEAYADCCFGWEKGEKRRNLDWRDLTWRTRAELAKQMSASNPDGYNNFDAETIAEQLDQLFGPETLYQFAREGSPALYVFLTRGKRVFFDRVASRLKANECSLEADGTIRLWWD